MSARLCRVWLVGVCVLGCERRGGDSQEQPVVQQPTWPAPVQVQPGVVQQPMMPQQPAAASLEQRVVWAEQRIARLEQQTVALSQESQTQRQQLAQTQMELAQTQAQVRAMQNQARSAQRTVRGMMQNNGQE